MSLGFTMFCKALVLTLWSFLVDGWEAYRKRRTERGLPLKQGRNGVYVVSDWTLWVNATARGIRNASFALVVVLTVGFYWLRA